jgi:hypothetical protein
LRATPALFHTAKGHGDPVLGARSSFKQCLESC